MRVTVVLGIRNRLVGGAVGGGTGAGVGGAVVTVVVAVVLEVLLLVEQLVAEVMAQMASDPYYGLETTCCTQCDLFELFLCKVYNTPLRYIIHHYQIFLYRRQLRLIEAESLAQGHRAGS